MAPPSTASSAPVMYDAASLARKATASATSLGLAGALHGHLVSHPLQRLLIRDEVPHHRGVDASRVHAVDADAVSGELDRRSLRHPSYGELAAGVGDQEPVASETLDARQVDDRASAGPLEGGVRLAHPEEAAEGVDVVDLAVDLAGRVAELVHEQDAGVVDEHVDLAERLLASLDRVAPRLLVGDVERDRDGALAKTGSDLLHLGQDVAEHHARALGHHQPRGGSTHPPGGPADERDLACSASWAARGHAGFSAPTTHIAKNCEPPP